MQPKKLLLFDFDGTVIDNSEGIFNCIRYAAGKLGLPCPDEKALRAFVGPPLYDSFTRYMGADHETALQLVDAYRERYRPLGTKEAVLYPDMKAALQALKAKGYVLAVCSGKPRDFLIEISKNLGVYDLFSDYYGTRFTDVNVTKSDYILQAISDFGATKETTLMLGDTKSDILAAKKAGVESLGVTYGFAAPGELEACGADLYADSVTGVYTLITGEPLYGTCVIFGAGEYDGARPAYNRNAFYIAADGGLAVMRDCGLTPDLVIGDFDSLNAPLPAGVPTVKLPVEKDVTDTDAAAAEGLKRGCSRFEIYGGLGGRPDHTLANYSLLARLSQQGKQAAAYGGGFEISAVTNGRIGFPAGKTGAAAVFSWTDESRGVTIKGLKYELENGTLKSDFALGASNSFTGEEAFVEVKEGTLLVMAENA